MQEDVIKIFCITHSASFTTPKPNSVVLCSEGSDTHALGENFPTSGRWLYCCDCQHYWTVTQDQNDFLRQCPACGSDEHPRYYSCDQCGTTMIDFSGAYYQKDFRIMPWGQPHPHCPGCLNAPKTIPQTHRCPVLRGLLTTALTECSFCEVDEVNGYNANGSLPPSGYSAASQIQTATEARRSENSAQAEGSVSPPLMVEQPSLEADTAVYPLESYQKKTFEREGGTPQVNSHQTNSYRSEAEFKLPPPGISTEEMERRVADAETKAREAEAERQRLLERMREVQDKLHQEIALRSEAELKAKKVEEEFKQSLESDWRRLEANIEKYEAEARAKKELQVGAGNLAEAREAHAQVQEEKYRAAIVEVKAEAQIRVQEAEARACQAEERARQAEEHYQNEVGEVHTQAQAALLANEQAQKEASETETRLREMEARIREAEARCQRAEAELRQETARRNLAEEIANELEAEFNRNLEITRTGFEAKIEKVKAESQNREETLLRQLAHQANKEIETITTDARARIEIEQKARHEAEQAKVEVEASAHKAENKARKEELERKEAERRYAVVEARLTDADVAARHTEERFNIERANARAEAEARIHQAEARANEAETSIKKYQAELAGVLEEIRISEVSARAAFEAKEEAERKYAETEVRLREVEIKAQEAGTRAYETETNASQVEKNLKAEIARILDETRTRLQEARANAHQIEERYKADLVSLRAEAETKVRQTEESYQAEVARVSAEFEAKLRKADAGARQTEENYKAEIAKISAEFEAQLREADARARQTEESYQAEVARVSAEFEAKLRKADAGARQTEENYKAEIARISAEFKAQLREADAGARQTEESYKAEIAKVGAEFEAQLREADARARQTEESYQAEVARVSAEAEAKAHRAKEDYKAEVARVSTEAEAKVHRAREDYKAEIVQVRAEAQIRVQEVEEQARQTEERLQAKVEEAIARAHAALLAIEEARRQMGEAEAKARETEARMREAEERCQQAEAGLRQETAQRALAEEKANELEVEFNHNLELVRTRIAKAQAEAKLREETIARQLAQQARKEIEAVTMDAHLRIETEKKARLEAEEEASDAAAKKREAEIRVRETEAKFREMELKTREAESKARRAVEEGKIKVARITAEAEARVTAITHSCEEAEKKYADAEAKALDAEAKTRAAILASNEAKAQTLQDESAVLEPESKYVADYTEQAIDRLRSVLESDPQNSQVLGELNKLLLHQGIALACRGSKAQARELLLEASELDPSNELVWLWLASTASSQTDAMAWLQKALEINPSDEQALSWMNNLRLQSKTFKSSLQCPLCASALPVKEDRCPGCRAILTLTDIDAVIDNMEVDRKTLLDAIERYQNLAGNNRDFGTHFHLGIAYLNLHQISEALKHLQIVSNLRPEDDALKAQVETLRQRQKASLAASGRKRIKTVKPKTIMIIDDSATVRKLVAVVLERYGHRVLVASGVMDALARLNDEVPDLVLLDIYMPGMDGYQLCSLIKGSDSTKDVPVVMLSGKDGFSDKVRGRRVGAVGHVSKPFDPATLIEAVETYCGETVGYWRQSANF